MEVDVITYKVSGGPFDIFEGETDHEKVEKFLNLGDDRNIAEVYIQGVCVRHGEMFLTGQASLTPALLVGKNKSATTTVPDLPVCDETPAEAEHKRTRLV
ncbi:MAG: hypothetical protein WDW38_009948 [Sanguina aurantia]